MIITSTMDSPVVPFQTKIDTKIKTLLNDIHPEFHTLSPILSGSFLISLFVAPNSYYSDYDFYFDCKENYLKAKDMLSQKYPLAHSNKNCLTFNLTNSLQLQIISTYFGTAAEIISQHDIENAKAAYQNESLFFTKTFLKSWIAGELELASFQEKSPQDYNYNFYSYCSTINRIRKYSKRYSLELSDSTIAMLKELKVKLLKNESKYSEIKSSLILSRDRDYWTGEEHVTQEEILIQDKTFPNLILGINTLLGINETSTPPTPFSSRVYSPEPIEF